MLRKDLLFYVVGAHLDQPFQHHDRLVRQQLLYVLQVLAAPFLQVQVLLELHSLSFGYGVLSFVFVLEGGGTGFDEGRFVMTHI